MSFLSLFRYPSRYGRALLDGTLPLRYCVVRFAHSTPTWRLPVSGQVSRLVAACPDSSGDCSDEVFALGVPLVSKSSPVRKRFRLNRKTPCTPRWSFSACSSTCVEEVVFFGDLCPLGVDSRRQRCDQQGDGASPIFPRTGVG